MLRILGFTRKWVKEDNTQFVNSYQIDIYCMNLCNSNIPLNVITCTFIGSYHQFNTYYAFITTHTNVTSAVTFQIVGKEKKEPR